MFVKIQAKFDRTSQLVRQFALACALLWLASSAASATTASATLAWQQSTNTTAVGYRIYYGAASGTYTGVMVVGNTNSVTITNLMPGVTYYFAATTYDAVGNESTFSNEAVFSTASAATLSSAVRAGGQFSFTVAGSSGSQYIVQASSDLMTWQSIQTNTVPFTFVDSQAGSYTQRFYRAVPVQ